MIVNGKLIDSDPNINVLDLRDHVPAGQLSGRTIRPFYPFQSQLIDDILSEMEADLNRMIDKDDIYSTEHVNFILILDEITPSVTLMNSIKQRALFTSGSIKEVEFINDHTDNWRVL